MANRDAVPPVLSSKEKLDRAGHGCPCIVHGAGEPGRPGPVPVRTYFNGTNDLLGYVNLFDGWLCVGREGDDFLVQSVTSVTKGDGSYEPSQRGGHVHGHHQRNSVRLALPQQIVPPPRQTNQYLRIESRTHGIIYSKQRNGIAETLLLYIAQDWVLKFASVGILGVLGAGHGAASR
ncbi:hypothetical protein F5146DRAFT_1005732 [Armillaria mellea]|nr:hypothetical protein F5146DRAFT_1005732 [Armillaria mellea]